MTNEQIERHVELRTDRLDARFLADNSPMTQEEYDVAIKNLSTWADYQYDNAKE